jgi:hypothetical protein
MKKNIKIAALMLCLATLLSLFSCGNKKQKLESTDTLEIITEGEVEEIYEALRLTGENKSSFLWYHDSHWTYSHKVSPMILSYLNKNTPINKTNFGGDIVDAESLDPNEMNYLYEWRSLIK